jgi:hypothetical protein
MTSWNPSNTNNDKKDEYQVTAGESKIKLSEHNESNANSAISKARLLNTPPTEPDE